MKGKLLRFLPVTAVLLTASCTDKQYDLSDINTESRFMVKELIIPLRMEPIKLDAIISIDDDSDIKKDEQGNYYFWKKCTNPFSSKDVNIEKITIANPADISEKIVVNITPPGFVNKVEQNQLGNKTIGEILNDPSLSNLLGVDVNSTIYNVAINDTRDINLRANNIDTRITRLEKLGVDPLTISIDVRLEELMSLVNTFIFKDLTVPLPCGFSITNISNNGNYDSETGVLSFAELNINNAKTNIQGTVTGFTYAPMEKDHAKFDSQKHTFEYIKHCNITGTASIKFSQLNPNATMQDIIDVTKVTYSCNVRFSDALVVNSFSGGVNYELEDVTIDPVKINNLPEMLRESGTNIELKNPQLYLDVHNPFYKNNISITTGLLIVGNDSVPKNKDGYSLTFDEEHNKTVLSPNDDNLYMKGYKHKPFTELRNLLSGDKVPEKLDIKIVKPVLDVDNVKDFELGKNHPGITGTWEFFTNLCLTDSTRIKYTKEWDDWGSGDLNKLTIEKGIITCKIKKDIELDADYFEFILLGRDGKILSGRTKLHGNEEQSIEIRLEGSPAKNIYGGKVNVSLRGRGNNLNKNQTIEISDLRLIVDGYYDTDL